MQWDELRQHEVLSFAGVEFSDAVLARLADIYLGFPSQFVFAKSHLQAAFDRAVAQHTRRLELRSEVEHTQRQALEASGLSAFPAFDPVTENLNAFALRVEAACGFQSGEILSTRGEATIVVAPVRPDRLGPDAFTTLLPLLEQSAPGVAIVFAGHKPD